MDALAMILAAIKAKGLKTCVYSGHDTVAPFKPLLPLLDYLKIGAYQEDVGNLSSPTTNQTFYSIHDGRFTDITYWFQRKKE